MRINFAIRLDGHIPHFSPRISQGYINLHRIIVSKNCPTPSNRSALMFCKEKDQTRDAASQHNRKREKKRIT